MGTTDRIPEADLERLLEAKWGLDGLSQLLAAASGPGTARELDGLGAAAAAFSAAGPGPDTTPRRNSMLKSVLAKLLAAKAAAAVAGTAAMGGVALAASTGALPTPLQNAAHAIGAPAAHSAHDTTVAQGSAGAATETGAPNTGESVSGTTGASTDEPTDAPSARPTEAPSPSLVGLCHAWSDNEHGNRATNPAFSVLVTTAGGSTAVSAYCTTLLASVAPHADGTPDSTSSTEPTETPQSHDGNPAEESHGQDSSEAPKQQDGQGDDSEAPEVHKSEHPETPESPEPQHSNSPAGGSSSGHDSGSQGREHSGDQGSERGSGDSGNSTGDN